MQPGNSGRDSMGQPKPFKFKFPDGRDSRAKKRVVRSVLFVLFCLAALTYNHDYRAPKTCALCHAMLPHYRTWEASAHQRASCVTCHQQPGLEGFVRFQTALGRMAYRYLTNSYYLPVTMRGKMSADTCFNCHALNRAVSASGNLTVPHTQHEQVGVNCLECHTGVVHANIARRSVALSMEVTSWTPSFTRKQMAYEFRLLPKNDCLECHRQRLAALDCSACHRDIYYPASHDAPDFLTEHGRQAYADLLSCDRCHSWTRGSVESSERMIYGRHPVRDYARNNTFCSECHLRRPAGHDGAFRRTHGGIAKKRGISGCQVCHDFQMGLSLPGVAANSAGVYCNTCHQGRHEKGWQERHPVEVRGKKYTRECVGCHGITHCGDCHQLE